MGFYERTILPRVMDKVTGAAMFDKLRTAACAPLYGDVLEIGFGSGTNVKFLPDSVTRLLAVDPATVGRSIAAPRIAARGVPVDFVGLDGARLELPDDSVDCVLSSLTLCTIPDVDAALREVARVLKPGGVFSYFEHGLSPRPSTRKWQNRLNGLQKRCAGGCHLNRSIHDLVDAAGLSTLTRADFVKSRSMAMFHWYVGTATV